MKSGRCNLGSVISTLLLLVIGAGLIYGNAFNREVGAHISNALEMPIVSIGVGAIMILSVVLRLIGGKGGRRENFIDFQADDGSVGISTKAIQDFIERVGKEFAAIKSIDSDLSPSKGGLDIAIRVKVQSGNKIPELSHVLQQRIRESVRESLGLEEIRNITIQVQEIIGDPQAVAVGDDTTGSE
jgi:uncharacterized alkaline shock family protein YloU